MYAFLLICSCSNPGEAGNSRGMSMSKSASQNPTITIQINSSISNHQAIHSALSSELSKSDAKVNVQVVQGETVSDRYVVTVGADVPPSVLMRIKKVLRTHAASAQPTFRTQNSGKSTYIYIGKAS